MQVATSIPGAKVLLLIALCYPPEPSPERPSSGNSTATQNNRPRIEMVGWSAQSIDRIMDSHLARARSEEGSSEVGLLTYQLLSGNRLIDVC